MTQTVIEKIIQEIISSCNLSNDDFLKINNILKLAKEKEEIQLLEFWNGGIDCESSNGKSFDQYYKQKFNKKL